MRHGSAATLAIATSLILSGCKREVADKDRAPAMTPTASSTPEAEKVSIIRTDVGIDREPKAPLAPLEMRVGFEDGGATLSASALAALDEVLASKQLQAGGAITLGGHTDSSGDDAANLRISRKRAEAVRDWLIDRGVAKERIEVVAFGEQNPVAPNAAADSLPNEAGRAKNRRVELTIAVPPGAPPTDEASDTTTLVEELTGQE